jgi:hypothetical protein
MAGIGDSWGTAQELLHPRDAHGRFRSKWKMSPSVLAAVEKVLTAFRPRTFQSDSQAAQYNLNLANARKPKRFGGSKGFARLQADYHAADEDLRDGNIDEPSTKKFVAMMDDAMIDLPDDVIVSRVVGPDAFGLTPERLPELEEMTGNVIADRGYGAANIGTPLGGGQGMITMIHAVPKGTKMAIPGRNANDRAMFFDRDQEFTVSKVKPDGRGGYNMFVVATPKTPGNTPETEGVGHQGPGTSHDREAAIKGLEDAATKREMGQQPAGALPAQPSEPQSARAARAAGQPHVPGTAQPQAGEDETARAARRSRILGRPSGPNATPEAQKEAAAPAAPAAPAVAAPEANAPSGATSVVTGTPATSFREAAGSLESPSAGPRRREWNSAYQGVVSGKQHPQDMLRELEADIATNKKEQNTEAGRIDSQLGADIEKQEKLADLIRSHFNLGEPVERKPRQEVRRELEAKTAKEATATMARRGVKFGGTEKAAPGKKTATEKATPGPLAKVAPKRTDGTPESRGAELGTQREKDLADDALNAEQRTRWADEVGKEPAGLGPNDASGILLDETADLLRNGRTTRPKAAERLREQGRDIDTPAADYLRKVADAIEADTSKPNKRVPLKKRAPKAAADVAEAEKKLSGRTEKNILTGLNGLSVGELRGLGDKWGVETRGDDKKLKLKAALAKELAAKWKATPELHGKKEGVPEAPATAVEKKVAKAAVKAAVKKAVPATPAARAKDKRVSTMASRLHEDWRKTRRQEDGSFEPRVKATKDEAWIAAHGTDQVDIANTDFADLPADWKKENQDAAGVIDKILQSNSGKLNLNDPEVRDRVGEEIHQEWLKRNDWAKGGELDVPFTQLSKSEQDKDIDQLRVAMGGKVPAAVKKTAAAKIVSDTEKQIADEAALADAKKSVSELGAPKTPATKALTKIAEAPEAPPILAKAAKKAAAVEGAAPGTAAGKITAARLKPGHKILVSKNDAGNWTVARKKTGATVLTVTGTGPASAPTGSLNRPSRRAGIDVRGVDPDGNEINLPVVGHQTFMAASEPKAPRVPRVAPAAVAEATPAVPEPAAPEVPKIPGIDTAERARLQARAREVLAEMKAGPVGDPFADLEKQLGPSPHAADLAKMAREVRDEVVATSGPSGISVEDRVAARILARVKPQYRDGILAEMPEKDRRHLLDVAERVAKEDARVKVSGHDLDKIMKDAGFKAPTDGESKLDYDGVKTLLAQNKVAKAKEEVRRIISGTDGNLKSYREGLDTPGQTQANKEWLGKRITEELARADWAASVGRALESGDSPELITRKEAQQVIPVHISAAENKAFTPEALKELADQQGIRLPEGAVTRDQILTEVARDMIRKQQAGTLKAPDATPPKLPAKKAAPKVEHAPIDARTLVEGQIYPEGTDAAHSDKGMLDRIQGLLDGNPDDVANAGLPKGQPTPAAVGRYLDGWADGAAGPGARLAMTTLGTDKLKEQLRGATVSADDKPAIQARLDEIESERTLLRAQHTRWKNLAAQLKKTRRTPVKKTAAPAAPQAPKPEAPSAPPIKATLARAAKATPATKKLPIDTDFRAANSAEEGHALLQGLNMDQLKETARANNVTVASKDNKTTLSQRIVNQKVQGRLDTEAILRSGAPATPPAEKQVAKRVARKEVQAEVTNSPQVTAAQDKIRAAYSDLAAEPSDRVSISKLRDKVGSDVSREDFDAALLKFGRGRDSALQTQENQQKLTPKERADAARIGARDYHFLVLDKSEMGPKKAASKVSDLPDTKKYTNAELQNMSLADLVGIEIDRNIKRVSVAKQDRIKAILAQQKEE